MASTGSSSSDPGSEVPAPRAEVVVGIASYNNADTIGAVAGSVRDGIGRASAASSSCIVVADGGSTDQTLERVREALGDTREVVIVEYPHPIGDPLKSPYHGLPGRPAAIHAVLGAAREREAKVCAVVDAGLSSLEAGWIQRLVEPALAGGFDYVSPYYLRHPHEGAITKSIVYPMFRALYGVRLRQPAAGEFGCSSQLMQHYLDQAFWDGEDAESGIDLWLASAAAAGGFRICEAVLGVRTQASRPETPDLSTTLVQVVGALFEDAEARTGMWQRIRGSKDVPAFGDAPLVDPSAPDAHVDRLLEAFRLGYRELRDVWAWILPLKTILQLKRLADVPADQFRIDDQVWARIIFDFALGHRLRTMPRDHLLRSLTPLYLGWLASFILEAHDADLAGTERRLEQLCASFEAQKPYLISRWRWPERFRA